MVKEFNPNFRVGQGGLVVVTASDTLVIADQPRVVLVDASSGPVTLTLFPGVGLGGKRICLKKIDSSGNAVTIAAAAGETIDGAATQELTTENESIDIFSDNEVWQKGAQGSGGIGGGSSNFPDSVPFNRNNSQQECLMFDDFFYNDPSSFLAEEKYRLEGEAVNAVLSNAGDSGVPCGAISVTRSGGLSAGQQSVLTISDDDQFSFLSSKNFVGKFRFELNNAVQSIIWAGFFSDDLNPGTTVAVAESGLQGGVFFRADNGASPGNWQAVSSNAGTQTVVDTGVAASTTRTNFEIDFTPTSVRFFINGTLVATITTNIPSNEELTVAVGSNIKTTANENVFLDAWYVRADR